MKYDKHHTDKIIQALADGQGRVRACKMAGITHETFMNWINQFSDFSDSVKKAEDVGEDKIEHMQRMKIIEDKSWQSGAWWLERTRPEKYANKQKFEHEIKEPIRIEVMSKEQKKIIDESK